MSAFLQKSFFVFRFRFVQQIVMTMRKLSYRIQGMQIGSSVLLSKIYTTWPNQVFIGNGCKIEHGIYFKFSGVWKEGKAIQIGNGTFIGNGCEFNIHQGIQIGNDCLIASGCKFIDHNHGIKAGEPIRFQKVHQQKEDEIRIGNDVWLGYNVLVLRGIHISDGAVVAAGSVVTKSIASNEIWAGVPAKKIGERK